MALGDNYPSRPSDTRFSGIINSFSRKWVKLGIFTNYCGNESYFDPAL